MCPQADGSDAANGVTNGANGHANGNAANGGDHPGYQAFNTHQASRPQVSTNPYAPVQDFLSNVSNFKIIESTLREGEQFANAFFDTETKIK
ncbi:hypothetical protein KC319_g22177, partial [Hortaea werneckii]